MTSMQIAANNVLNGMDESAVITVITLYDKGFLKIKEDNRRLDMEMYLTRHLGMSEDNVKYWLDWFQA